MSIVIALGAWLFFTTAALALYCLQAKEPSHESNRKRSLWSGLIITAATLAMFIFLLKTDEAGKLADFAKDYVSLLGSVIGGNLLVQGMQKKLKEA